MNQILVTEKLYITPELRKKKKIYKFDFFISIFLVCILFSYYIYAEYDKNKNEAISQEILHSLSFEDRTRDNTTIQMEKNDALVVILNSECRDEEIIASSDNIADPNGNNSNAQVVEEEPTTVYSDAYYTDSGSKYYSIGRIYIPAIDVDYPILETDLDNIDEILKISPTKFWGCAPNEVGNFCVVGHNYRNTKFFSKVPTLDIGDTVEITDMTGRMIVYEIYDMYEVDPEDRNCTSQLTNGRKEVTVITCTNDSQRRVIVKAKERI